MKAELVLERDDESRRQRRRQAPVQALSYPRFADLRDDDVMDNDIYRVIDDGPRKPGRMTRRALLIAAVVAGVPLAAHASSHRRPAPALTVCRAPTTAAWKRLLTAGLVPISRRASVTPLAAAGDGRTFFASVYSKSFSGVARIDARSGRLRRIKRFPNPVADQAVGNFDGRWLVWHEYRSLSNFDRFTTWSWDSGSHTLRKIGAATRSRGGAFWSSPWRAPDARAGFATWVQGSGPNGVADVHVFDLAAHRDRIVRHGHPQGSFLVAGGLVAWPESPRPGVETKMRAANVGTGRAVVVPPALRSLRGVSALVSGGTALAYPNADYTSLWWSPSLATRPRRLFRTNNPAAHIDNSVQVAGHFIAFGSAPPATYLLDAARRRYVKLSAGGFIRMDAHSLVLLTPAKRKAVHPISDVIFLRLAALPPFPSCR